MTTPHTEHWLPLLGYEGLYEISSLGAVARVHPDRRTLLRAKDGGQACVVSLANGAVRRYPALHLLVARHFVPNPDGHTHVLHIDGDHRHNAASNLRWCPLKDRVNHLIRLGKRGVVSGEANNLSKLTAAQAREIFTRYHRDGISAQRLGREYGLAPVSVHRILNRESWRRETEDLVGQPAEAHAGKSVIQTLDGEEWRDIKGYEGLYQISSLGRIQSLNRVSDSAVQPKGRRMTGRLLEPQLNTKGYYHVSLCREGVYHRCPLHRLVAKHFLSNPDDLPVVNHIDLNPRNNRADNLEWTSSRRNSMHTRHVMLTDPRFRDKVKYTLDDVREIKRLWAEGSLTQRQLATRFKLTPSNISYIVGNSRWDPYL